MITETCSAWLCWNRAWVNVLPGSGHAARSSRSRSELRTRDRVHIMRLRQIFFFARHVRLLSFAIASVRLVTLPPALHTWSSMSKAACRLAAFRPPPPAAGAACRRRAAKTHPRHAAGSYRAARHARARSGLGFDQVGQEEKSKKGMRVSMRSGAAWLHACRA